MQDNWILLARKKLNLTQQEFADMLGVSIVTVSRWENGHRNPKNKVLIYIANILSVTPDELLDCKISEEVV